MVDLGYCPSFGKRPKDGASVSVGRAMPGERALCESDPFEPFEGYVRQRLSDDPHVWVSALFDEVVALGYSQS